MNILSIDPGSSFTKGYSDRKLESISIPSIATALTAPDLKLHDSNDILWVNENPYLTGWDAQAQQDMDQATDAQSGAGFHGSDLQEVLICATIDEMGFGTGEEVLLIQSLPFSQTQDRALVEQLKARRELKWRKGDIEKSITLSDRIVVAQGVGALVEAGLQNDSTYRNIILADIGSITLDCPVLTWHQGRKSHTYHNKSHSSRQFNVRKVVGNIIRSLKNLEGLQDRKFGYHDIAEMHQERRYKIVHGATLKNSDEVSPIFEAEMRRFTKDIQNHLRESVGDEMWDRADRIVVAGGGVHWLDKSCWDSAERTTFLDEWSNVKGQYNSFQEE